MFIQQSILIKTLGGGGAYPIYTILYAYIMKLIYLPISVY